MARKPIGIRRRRSGWRVTVRVCGHLYTKQFPFDEPIAKMKDWRELQQERFSGAAAGTFAGDVDAYLAKPEIAAMPSFTQRRAHLTLWLNALGRDRPRRGITATELDAVLQGWLATLSPVTVDHRRTALLSLFVSLDGADAANPVRATTKPAIPPAEARDVDYQTIARILAAMPNQRPTKRTLPPRLALGKLRAAVIAYTGLPPASLKQITAADLNLEAGTVRLPGRQKGAGTGARVLPLTADGIAAFKAFHAANAYGAFPTENLSVIFKRAVKRAKANPRIRLYDLRHSFGAEVYRRTGDLATVARLLGHAEGSTVTARYAQGANAEVDAAAVKAFNAARKGERLPAKSPARRKRRRIKYLRRRA